MTNTSDFDDLIPSLRTRIRESWAPTMTTYFASLPIAGFAIWLSTAPVGGGQLPARLAILVCCLLGGLPWILLAQAVHRKLPRLSVPWVIAFLLASGAFLGAMIEALERVFGLTESTEPLVRMALTSILLTWWFLSVALVLDGRRRVLAKRNQLINERVALLVASSEHSELLSRVRERISSDLSARLQPAVQVIDAKLRRQQDDLTYEFGEETAATLHDAARNSVRPISRQLWQITGDSYSVPGYRSLIWRIISMSPFRPVAVAVIFAATALAGPSGQELSGIAEVGLVSLAILAFLNAANALMRRWPRQHAAIFVTVTVLLQAPTLLAAGIESIAPEPDYTLVDALVRSALGLIIIVTTSGFGSWRRSHVQVMETMRSDLDRDEVAARAQERVTAQILRDLAQHLHGDVQSRLFAAASEIDKANSQGDIGAMRDALQDAKEILANALPDEGVTKPSDLAENLEQLTALWRGLARVEYRISAPELLDPGSARALAAIAEEAVANGVRHGDATEISIEIYHDAGRCGWQIVVLDNGTGPTGGDTGLGSTLFTELTDGNWSMQAEASSGTRLHAFVHAPVATHGPEPQGSRD